MQVRPQLFHSRQFSLKLVSSFLLGNLVYVIYYGKFNFVFKLLLTLNEYLDD
jgi:hypothetical protein